MYIFIQDLGIFMQPLTILLDIYQEWLYLNTVGIYQATDHYSNNKSDISWSTSTIRLMEPRLGSIVRSRWWPIYLSLFTFLFGICPANRMKTDARGDWLLSTKLWPVTRSIRNERLYDLCMVRRGAGLFVGRYTLTGLDFYQSTWNETKKTAKYWELQDKSSVVWKIYKREFPAVDKGLVRTRKQIGADRYFRCLIYGSWI